jgi:hypothetical protein
MPLGGWPRLANRQIDRNRPMLVWAGQVKGRITAVKVQPFRAAGEAEDSNAVSERCSVGLRLQRKRKVWTSQ